MRRVRPLIRAQLRDQTPEDALDMESEIVYRVVRRLEGGSQNCAPLSFSDFSDFCAYVKVAARAVCCNHIGASAARERPLSAFGQEASETAFPLDAIPDSVDVAHGAALREHLDAVWSETLLLPHKQRLALLLFLRDRSGGSALWYWLHLGKSRAEVAGALGVSESALPELMEQLPLDDNAIGNRMGLSRTEVCTLRVAARKRLERRTRLWF